MYRGILTSGLASHWRREVLRTSLWFVPAIEVAAAIALFAVTLTADRAAYRGDFTLPGWVISGSADAARQILTTIAAAIITVVGVVFSIILVTLTLASTQFGPRMLRPSAWRTRMMEKTTPTTVMMAAEIVVRICRAASALPLMTQPGRVKSPR